MILRARKDNSEIKVKPFSIADYDNQQPDQGPAHR